VITITAQTRFDYTEPIPVDVNVNEPQVHENEQNEERSSFAELLAGLLQNTQPAPPSETGLDVLAVEKAADGNKLNLFLNAAESGSKLQSEAVTDGLEIDLSDTAIEKEYQNILSADHLFNSSLNMEELNEELSGLPQELDANTINNLIDMALKKETSIKDPSSVVTEKSKTDSVSQSLASLDENTRRNIEEALAEIDNKKKRLAGEQSLRDVHSKNDKVETLSAKNKAGEDNAALLKNDKREDNQAQSMGRLDELRSRSRRDRVSFEVRDMRTTAGINNLNNTERPFSVIEAGAVRIPGQAPVQEITLELRLPDQGLNSSQTQVSWETKAGNSLENMLARELHQNFNGDIVRHASMALRDNGMGTIKLMLRPETLGNVKIHLELSENKITGRIVVESLDALNAFRKEISSLEQAFKDSGFADASFDLSFAAEGENLHQEHEDNSFTPRMVTSRYEDSSYNGEEQDTVSIIDFHFGRKSGSINMLA